MDPEIMFKKEDLATVDIQEEDLTTKELIGKGQFGSVYRGLWKGLQVAIKQIPRGYGDPDISEVNICRRLRHPNIIMLFGCFISETDTNIITNYIKGVNLGVALGLIRAN
ncbi:probable serine/threonine-protein kinase drkB isoform X3 [Actinia tenebrosa]|uniref:Probable serine/threonine-protein kinase drkB isoform X3 n=1 Tax=Actinia tenebrosa TaxID=6105 RepID=A0A6P8HCT7_ACTTE|nr:probable serine/threonine-protein kinase drkB isoform X3 [Actinia tenebrosa]